MPSLVGVGCQREQWCYAVGQLSTTDFTPTGTPTTSSPTTHNSTTGHPTTAGHPPSTTGHPTTGTPGRRSAMKDRRSYLHDYCQIRLHMYRQGLFSMHTRMAYAKSPEKL